MTRRTRAIVALTVVAAAAVGGDLLLRGDGHGVRTDRTRVDRPITPRDPWFRQVSDKFIQSADAKERDPATFAVVVAAREAKTVARLERLAWIELSEREAEELAGRPLGGTGGRLVLLRHADAVLAQGSYSAACNSLHRVEQRCCRWLLMTHDQAELDHVTLTQEFLARMLGVQRTSVTEIARCLQRAGLIRYSRGKITVPDRPGLKSASCVCYGNIKAKSDALPACPSTA